MIHVKTKLIDEILKDVGTEQYEGVNYRVFEGVITKSKWYFTEKQCEILIKNI